VKGKEKRRTSTDEHGRTRTKKEKDRDARARCAGTKTAARGRPGTKRGKKAGRGCANKSRSRVCASKSRSFVWDEKAAERIVNYWSKVLVHPRGRLAGRPFEPMGWWKRDILRPLFGWKRKDGTRRYRRGLIYVPKKNVKSMGMAAIGLYLTTSDGEIGARVYAVATDEEQTDRIMGAAMGMAKRSPLLKRRLKVIRSTNTIVDEETDSSFQGITGDALSAEGLDASAILADELHVWRGRLLWDALSDSGSARRQPLQLAITTAGVWDPEAVWWEEYKYAKGVLDGAIKDPRYFAYIAEATVEDDPLSPATWRKANPSLGIVFSEERFREDLERAKRSPAAWNQFLRYRLNIPSMGVSAEYDMEAWNRCERKFTEEDLAGRPCCAGIDLAATTDLTALSLVFPPLQAGEPYFVLAYAFLPEEAMEKAARRGDARYLTWAKQGFLEVTPGRSFDHERMREKVNELGQKFQIVEVAFDPWNAVKMGIDLVLDGFNCVQFRQGTKSFAGVMNAFEKYYQGQEIAHDGNPALRWNLSNLVADVDKNRNKCPNKKKSGAKIDMAVAMLMGLDRAMATGDRTSIYAKEKPMVV